MPEANNATQTTSGSKATLPRSSSRRPPTANRLIVQDHAEEGSIDFEIAVVIDEAEISELVHEEIDARTGRPDHFCQGLLGDLGDALLRSLLIAVPRQQQ